MSRPYFPSRRALEFQRLESFLLWPRSFYDGVPASFVEGRCDTRLSTTSFMNVSEQHPEV
jgi:hypothetical protein